MLCRRGRVRVAGDDGSRVLAAGEDAGHPVHLVVQRPHVRTLSRPEAPRMYSWLYRGPTYVQLVVQRPHVRSLCMSSLKQLCDYCVDIVRAIFCPETVFVSRHYAFCCTWQCGRRPRRQHQRPGRCHHVRAKLDAALHTAHERHQYELTQRVRRNR